MKRLLALLLAVIMVLSMAACGKDKGEATPDQPTQPVATPDQPTEPEIFVPELGEGVYSKTSYTVTDQALMDARQTVVATVGDKELTLGTLQVYYWMSVYGFLNEYGQYAAYFGLDPSRPLDQQACPDSDGTWQQHFLNMALEAAHSYEALHQQGLAEQSPMDPELKEELDGMKANMEKAAQEGGHASLDAMLLANTGPGITYEDYDAYVTGYYKGYSHYLYRCDQIQITDADVDAYYEANQDLLTEKGITKEEGKVVDIRHILATIEGGTTDEAGNTTYSDADWAKCEQEAQAILDQWLAGDATEETFAALAGICTDDPGSKQTGGLYENVKTGDMVEPFDAWCFDTSRKVGDYGLVKTDYGYHVMYYSGDEALWIYECRQAAKSEAIGQFVDEAMQTYPLHVDYDKIMLGHVNLAG